MLKLQRARPQLGDRIAFLREFLRHPQQVASIVPSSRFLERRVVEIGNVQSAGTVVELGAGTGGLTRAILRAMPREARLLSVEINPRFRASLERIGDSRLVAHTGSACELEEVLSLHDLAAPEVVISGIPFSKIGRASASEILETIATVLAPGGRFVAYQLHKRVESLCNPLLGPAEVEVELRNIPPLRIYRWQKQAALASGR